MPRTGPELLDRLRTVHRQVSDWYGGLPPEIAVRRARPGDWAPVDDLRHLTLATRALTRGFRAPTEELVARFGSAEHASRSTGEIARMGQDALEGGATSPEAMIPQRPEGLDDARLLEVSLRDWQAAARELEAVVPERSEEELDRIQIPHPFLGLFTLREWISFNAVHAMHHLEGSQRRIR